jgi:hypothetical protein
MAIEEKTSSNQELLAEITKIIGKQVPVEVKNYEAYLEHLKLNNNPIHTIKLQIGEKTMPITHPFPVINKALKKAIELEQIDQDRADKIYNMKRQQQNLKLKAMAKIKQAYGTVVNKHGEIVKNKSIFEPVRVQMIELFGRMFSGPEVHEVCLRQWKLSVTLNQVSDFRKQEMIEINKRVEEHKRTYSDIRLGHKRSRLEELVWLYNDRKRKYEISGKGEDHRLLLSTLDQIKKEAEGDLIRIDGNINFGLDQTIENHIQKDLNKTIPIKELVLARVAAKTGVDPINLINFLNKSLYRKVLDAETVDFEEMPQYPSLQNYDFDKIKNVNVQAAQEKILEAKIIKKELHPQQIHQSEALRQALLRKLSDKVGDLNQEKNSLSENFDTPM